MPLDETVDAYTNSLKNLVRVANEHVLTAPATRGVLATLGGDVGEIRSQTEQSLDAIARLTDSYLESASSLEAELQLDAARGLEAESEAYNDLESTGFRLAALMQGHWIAATAITVVASETPISEVPDVSTEAERRRLLSFDRSPAFAQAFDQTDLSPGFVLMQQAVQHDVDEVVAGLSGIAPIRGGAGNPAQAPIAHIVSGVVGSCGPIVATAASGALIVAAQQAAATFVSGALSALPPVFGGALGRIRRLAMRIVAEATSVARKLLGDANWADLTKWLDDHVVALLRQFAAAAVSEMLDTAGLEAKCAAMFTRLSPDANQRVVGRLDAVSANYDEWSKWGTTGARFLRYLPTAILGAAAIPVLGAAVIGLFAYQLWVGQDHLDWPANWPLPNRSAGVFQAVVAG